VNRCAPYHELGKGVGYITNSVWLEKTEKCIIIRGAAGLVIVCTKRAKGDQSEQGVNGGNRPCIKGGAEEAGGKWLTDIRGTDLMANGSGENILLTQEKTAKNRKWAHDELKGG